MMKYRNDIAVPIVLTLAMLMGIGQSMAAGLSASINSLQVAQGDQFQLTLSADAASGEAPDLTPLSQDFEILGTSQSSQTQIINGQMSQRISWIVTLSPLKDGTLSIPGLQAGSVSSDPLSIDVVEASQLPKLQGAAGISLIANIEHGNHYRFQEIPVTVRVESTQPIQSAELITPQGDFELTATGQQRQGQISRGGQSVNVVEQSYLLRPQAEGDLTIAPFTLKGTIQDPGASRDPFSSMFGGRDPFAQMQAMMGQMGGGMFNSRIGSMFGAQGKPFVARSEVLSIQVQANPDGDESGWFLPARSVQLTGEWLDTQPTFREGEGVARRISILALGAREEQLPELQFDQPDGARIYVDNVKTDTISTVDGSMARRDYLISVVPTHGGEVQLAAIEVDWLNTDTGESQTARLAGETIVVEGMPASMSNNVSPEYVTDSAAENSAGSSDHSVWWWLLTGGTLVVLSIAAFVRLMLYRRRENNRQKNASAQALRKVTTNSRVKHPKPMRRHSDLLAKLATAARANNTEAFYQSLLQLRAGRNNSRAVEAAIRAIEQCSYAQHTELKHIDLFELLASVKGNRAGFSQAEGFRSKNNLPPLYPVSAQ